MTRQRLEQKGKSGSVASTILRQVGQRSEGVFFFFIGQGSGFRVAASYLLSHLSRAKAARRKVGHPAFSICSLSNLQQSRDQVVIVGLFHDGAVKAAGLGRGVLSEIVDEYLAVDLRGVGRGAGLPEQVGLLAGPLEHDFDLAADPLLAALAADAL